MQNKAILFGVLAGIVFIAIVLIIGTIAFGQSKAKGNQPLSFFEKTAQENKTLQDSLAQAQMKITQLESLLQKKEQEAKNLANTHGVKEALFSAQTAITQLNQELEQAKSDKERLEDKSATLNSRYQSLTVELTRNLQDLKNARQELDELRRKRADTVKTDTEFLGKESQIKSLQLEVARLNNEKLTLTDKLAKIESSRSSRELMELRSQVSGLQSKLSAAQNELSARQGGLSRVKEEFKDQSIALSEDTKSKIAQLSEILAYKEMELNAQKKESLSLKAEVDTLKKNISGFEKEIKSSQTDTARVKALESEKLILEAKLNQAQQDMRKQNELIASLTNAMDTLNKRIVQKDEENKKLQFTLTRENSSKVSSEEELSKQKTRVDELNNFYGGLKNQIVQFSQFLNEKETELGEKYKEIARLQDELGSQQSKIGVLEKELAETKSRQRKIIENLSQAKDLNSALQENLSDVAQSLDQKEAVSISGVGDMDKEKAEELKRKIEIILTPQPIGN